LQANIKLLKEERYPLLDISAVKISKETNSFFNEEGILITKTNVWIPKEGQTPEAILTYIKKNRNKVVNLRDYSGAESVFEEVSLGSLEGNMVLANQVPGFWW
jgi:hypothetical protein